VRAADVIVTSSRYVEDSLTDIGVPPSRVVVIPYGVDLERFRPPASRADDGVVRALYVGRLSERKGVHYVCEAFDRLALPNLELTLLGAPHGPGPWDAPRGERFVRRAAVAHHEVHEAYRRADVFIQMSLHESSAMTIYEALASGLPVVTTPNSGSVVRDGVDGFIVPAGDVAALADRVRLLVGDRALREEMGRNARRRAEEFSWERYRERFGSLIVDLLDAPAPDGWQRVVDEHRRRMADVLGTVGGAGLGVSGGASSTTGAIGAGNGGED